MSATAFNEADHPRAAGGQWAEKNHSEADVDLGDNPEAWEANERAMVESRLDEGFIRRWSAVGVDADQIRSALADPGFEGEGADFKFHVDSLPTLDTAWDMADDYKRQRDLDLDSIVSDWDPEHREQFITLVAAGADAPSLAQTNFDPERGMNISPTSEPMHLRVEDGIVRFNGARGETLPSETGNSDKSREELNAETVTEAQRAVAETRALQQALMNRGAELEEMVDVKGEDIYIGDDSQATMSIVLDPGGGGSSREHLVDVDPDKSTGELKASIPFNTVLSEFYGRKGFDDDDYRHIEERVKGVAIEAVENYRSDPLNGPAAAIRKGQAERAKTEAWIAAGMPHKSR